MISYKEIVKDKSKRIYHITENNIELRSQISELEQKMHQLNSYSNWQENQITQLRLQLADREKLGLEENVLQEKIDRLEIVLKNYEDQFRSDEKSKVISKESLEGEIRSV